MQRGTQFGLVLWVTQKHPWKSYRRSHPVARMWKNTAIFIPINLLNNTGDFKKVLCSPASGLLWGLEGPWRDLDACSLPGLCWPWRTNCCILMAGGPWHTPAFHRTACKESWAEAGSPSQGDVDDPIKTVLKFFVKMDRTAVLVKISATAHTCSFGFSFYRQHRKWQWFKNQNSPRKQFRQSRTPR